VCESQDSTSICRCEEVTRTEIVKAIREGATSLSAVKRVTRAGMGLCQGRTCQKTIIALLAEELGRNPGEIAPPSVRPPLRPLALKTLVSDGGGSDAENS